MHSIVLKQHICLQFTMYSQKDICVTFITAGIRTSAVLYEP
jgi:hypothetical protein